MYFPDRFVDDENVPTLGLNHFFTKLTLTRLTLTRSTAQARDLKNEGGGPGFETSAALNVFEDGSLGDTDGKFASFTTSKLTHGSSSVTGASIIAVLIVSTRRLEASFEDRAVLLYGVPAVGF